MSLSAGTRLGPYEVTAPIGAGGMGEVYRARDTQLDRDVALKILPDLFASDPDRLMRFTREARTLASLNHTNIAHIHGLEESGGVRALVMELVEGPDLSAMIAAAPGGQGLRPEDALPIARQIADALEAAHEQGIIHRDLKPANIKVRHDGTVKVLDFGLAKALDPSGASDTTPYGQANSPTMSARMTEMGLILGTAAYMSPEQARGKRVDKRADIWAFGCVLYEMLTGRQAFAGETVTDILAAVVKNEPDWDALPADTPSAVRNVLRRCLQKDPRQRLRDIGDALIEFNEPESARTPDATGSARPAQSRRGAAVVAVLTLLIGIAGGSWWRGAQDAPSIQWEGSRLGGPAVALYPRVSPDGQLLAFLAMVDGLTQIAVMKPGTGNWTTLTNNRTAGLVDSLAWSADGARIYFDRWTDSPKGIFSVPALGGDERLLLENAGVPQPLPDGSLLVVRVNADRVGQLHRLWPDTGQLESLPVIMSSATFGGFTRPLGRDRVAVFGRALADVGGRDQLHVLTLSSKLMTRAGPEFAADVVTSMAVDARDQSILLAVREGSAIRVLRIRPDEQRTPELMMTFLSSAFIDASVDGSVFMGLVDRPVEVLGFRAGSPAVEHLSASPTLFRGAIGLSGGRHLITERLGTTSRVLIVTPGKEPIRLVETTEDTRQPMTRVGTDRVAMLIGSGPAPDIAIVAVESGRILKRLTAPANISSLAASPDGTTLYATVGGSVLAVPVDGRPSRPLGAGDSVTVDPDTGDLIVKLDEQEGYRLVRMTADGASPQSIEINGSLRMASEPLMPGAIRSGRLLLTLASTDSWYWHAGVLDLRTGRLEKIELDYLTDIHFATWADDGSVIGSGQSTEGTLWKFTPGRKD